MNTQTHFPRTAARIEAGVITSLRAVSPATRPLTAVERKELLECEAKIYSGLDQMAKCWREIVQRWQHIRDERLYREEFRTMEAYSQAKFGKSASRLRQLVRAEGVMQDLEEGQSHESKALRLNAPPTTDTGLPAPSRDLPIAPDLGARAASGEPQTAKQRVLPIGEGQARPLAPLPKGERIAAWERAKEIAGEGKQPTVKQVAKAVAAFGVREHTRGAGKGAADLLAGTDELIRKDVLDASQRAVVAIRVLQDMVAADARHVGRCNAAVRSIEAIEREF